jgi:hypothetical protein
MRWALVLGALTWAPLASAQNYRELPLGGRTATMGGAATAAGNDSAMPYLNPAGMAGVPGDILGISATIYSFTRRSFQNYFYPNGAPPELGLHVERESFATDSIGELPSSVMYFKHLSAAAAHVQHHLGLALVIPGARQIQLVADVQSRLERADGQAFETSAINAEYRHYYLGPGYAVGFGDRFRLGVSGFLVLHHAIVNDTISSSVSLLGGASTSTFSGSMAQLRQGWSLVPVVGFQLRLYKDVWLGAGLAAPGVGIAGRQRFSSDSSGTSVDPVNGAPLATSQISAANLDYRSVDPLRINVGVAYDKRDSWALAFDVHSYAGHTNTQADGVQTIEQRRAGDVTRSFGRRVTYSTTTLSIIDLSIGAELAIGKVLALRAGAFSDLAASEPLRPIDNDLRRLRIDRYGGTLGLGLRFGSFDTTIGGILVRGTGKYGAPDTWATGSAAPITTTETTAMLVLSGAVTVQEAIDTIHKTVPFETRFLPSLAPRRRAQPLAPRIPRALSVEPKPPEPRPLPAASHAPASANTAAPIEQPTLAPPPKPSDVAGRREQLP